MNKKYFNKSLSLLLVLLMVLLAIPFSQLSVVAVANDSESVAASVADGVGAVNETESNDDYASANSFSLNGTISGKMSSYDDEDYFKITTTKNGKVALMFNNTYTDSSVYWRIKMICYQGGSYTEFYNETIYANSGETRALPSIGATSGNVYYISVSTSSYYNTTGINYSINNVFTATEYYEKEIDNSYSAATSMVFNQTYGGVMNNYGDVDYYKFIPSQNGKIALTFNNTFKDASVYWNIKMYCYQGGSYTEFYNETIYANSGETRALPSIGATSGSVYYIVISTSSYYNSIGLDYSIKNVFTATEYYEKEIDNSYSAATSMDFNQTYGGVMNNDGDVDYYKFSPSQNGKIALTFNNTYKDASVYWNIKMYCYQGGSYTEFYNETIYANSGETRALPSIGAVSGSIYYIVISTSSYYNSIGLDYSIKNVFTATEYYEKEINNTYPTATVISANQTYGGVMNNYGDSDYYKISLSQSSMPFYFTHESINSSSTYWSIKILKYNSGTYDEVFSKTLYMNDTAGQLTTITSSGTYYICISTSSYYNTTGCEYNILIGTPDTTKPTGSISSTNNVASSQTVTLKLSDNVGIAGYYWGTSSSYSSNTYNQTASTSVTVTVSSSGTYYLTVKDTSGNISTTVSKTFYKTTLDANGGTVTPTSVITMNGNSFTFPTPTFSGNTYKGWSTDSTATSGVYSLTPTSNKTYYAIWEPNPSYGITLSKTSLTLTVGSTSTLTATTTPSGQSVTWTSSNTTAATVSSNGLVTAKAQGSTTINAKFTYNGTTYGTICSVTVIPNPSANAKIAVESKTASSGKEVTLAVSLNENPGLAYLKLKVSYNASALEFVSAQNTGLLTGTFTTSKTTDVNPYVIQWMGADNSNGNGTIVNLTFRVKDNAPEGNYTITLTPEEAYNSSYDDVTFTVTNGVITVKNVIIGDVNGDGTINGKDGILLSQYLADWDVTIVDAAADCNGDGIINGKDGILLSQYLADWDVTLG